MEIRYDDKREDERILIEVRHEEDDMIKLYEASVRGHVPTLNELIQKDPLVLNNISLMSLRKTLLHISASLGHLDFTIALLYYKRKLATELDSHNRSALHLASAEGHTEIVKALLHVNNHVCLTADEEGRIPLHYAVMTGHIEVIQLLINKRPESIWVKAGREKTVLHLCVLYNHLEALKLLVEYVNNDSEFLNLKDHDGGNTILHLAVMLKQLETTNYLLSRPGVEKNALNGVGFTALDVIEHCSRDFKSLEIRNSLMIKGVEIAKNQNDLPPPPPTSIPVNSRWWEKGIKLILSFLRYRSDWLEKTPKTLMLVATVITTTTFQSAINPPGGLWQENVNNSTGFYCDEDYPCVAGTAVLAYSSDKWDTFNEFFAYNTVSFVASLFVIIVLVSGVPLQNKICLALLTVGMTLTLISMGIAYLDALWLVIPDIASNNIASFDIITTIFWENTPSRRVMICCIGIFCGFNALRLVTSYYNKVIDKALTYYKKVIKR